MSAKQFKEILWYFIFVFCGILIFSILNYKWSFWPILGPWSGKIAIYLVWIIALPGIFRRLKLGGIFKKISSFLSPSKRYLGILMFLIALSHALWTRYFGYFKFQNFPDPNNIARFETFGFLALIVAFILFVTSNDFAVKILKKNWYLLHKMFYILVFLAAFHTSLQSIEYFVAYGIITFCILALQIYSYVSTWINKRNLKKS
jgi:methionine sulfoxide reductase heme-binding subunit